MRRRHAILASVTAMLRESRLPPQPQESRIELTCLMIDDSDPVAVERTEETKAEWKKAKAIAERFAIGSRFEIGSEYGDGYLYPSLAVLEKVLVALDKASVGYDNIDLPPGAPIGLVNRLKARYPAGRGVMVNPGQYP